MTIYHSHPLPGLGQADGTTILIKVLMGTAFQHSVLCAAFNSIRPITGAIHTHTHTHKHTHTHTFMCILRVLGETPHAVPQSHHLAPSPLLGAS